MCTQQVWDLEGLEQRVPKDAEFWFRYHADFLGIDEIYLYDLDGSYKDLRIVQELRSRGKLFYEDSIASIPPLREVFELAGYKTSTTHLAQTLVQQHCWHRARQNADWVISVSHGWDMFLFSPSMGTISELLQELRPDEVTYVLGVRYGVKEDAEAAAEASNVFTRFPYHNDPSIRPEQLLSTEEQIVIANPRLVDCAVLGEVVVRQEAPLRSNLLEPLEPCPGRSVGPEFSAPSVQKRRLDPWRWRANHYVSLLGRSVVFRVEESTPELREFSIYDEAAVALGHRLASFG